VRHDVGYERTVEIGSGELEAVPELAVGQAPGPDGDVDVLDLQGPEI
jgi:hypothetical protein